MVTLFDSKHINYRIIIRRLDKFNGLLKKTIRINKDYCITYKHTKYPLILKYIQHSKCLLDIVIAGQTGLTIRVMEAMAFKKKLITNNVDIQKYDFYNKNNIFILGLDSLDDLPDFIHSPYEEISQAAEYDSVRWLNRFFE